MIIIEYLRVCIHLLKVFFQLMWGLWKLSRIKYAPVTIFGGTRLKRDNIYMQKSHQLAHMLAEHYIPVITGGGPGAMQAANCGAKFYPKEGRPRGDIISTMGIGVKDLGGEFNPCAQYHIILDHFFARKWLLINYSVGFAVIPGGFGTLDELTELLTLIQTKMRKKAPIVLIGKEYWAPFMTWVRDSALKNDLITQEDIDLFSVTDDVQEAFDLLKLECQNVPFKFQV